MKLVVANWKENMNLAEIGSWLMEFENFSGGVEVVIAPPHAYLSYLAENAHNIKISSQDVSEFGEGKHTGEVSAAQVKDFGAYAIVGHSERKENREIVYKKIENCLSVGLVPIVCFVDLKEIEKFPEGVVLAWEDPENISGAGGESKAKPISEIASGIDEIRKLIKPETKLIYGGSVGRQNSCELGKMNGLDGVLVGNASLDPKHFQDIIKDFEEN